MEEICTSKLIVLGYGTRVVLDTRRLQLKSAALSSICDELTHWLNAAEKEQESRYARQLINFDCH